MPTGRDPGPPHAKARFAGAMYAIVVVTGIFGLAYAPGQLFAGADAAEALRTATAQEGLLRAMIAAELACYVAFIALALALYRLLAGAGRFAALMMAGLALSSVPFGYANVGHLFEILRAVEAGGADAEGAVAAALARYKAGLFVQSVPWGLWLIPLGYLTFRSGFLPRIIGVLLILGGVGYVVDFLGRLLLPEPYAASGIAPILDRLSLSELLMCFWLLVFGARRSLFGAARKTDAAPA